MTVSPSGRPKALLIVPPVYDFAFHDLFVKPYGLLRIARWLLEGGWDVAFVNGLDYTDQTTESSLGQAKRKPDGSGKFFRRMAEPPPGTACCGRRYYRYGIDEESLRRRIEKAEILKDFGFSQFIGQSRQAPRSAGQAPDIILVSTMMTYWYTGVVEAVRICRRVWPRTNVVVGGVYATLMPLHCRASTEADDVIAGEAWSGLSDIFTRLGLPLPAQPPPRRPLALPEVWRDAGVLRLNEGCPFSCDYCASGVLSEGFCAGEPEEAFQAFRELAETCGTRNFAFYDDALLFRKKEILHPFLRKVAGWAKQQDMPLPGFSLPNAVHIRYLDDETAGLMRRAGVREIRMGYESSSGDFHVKHDDKFEAADFPAALYSLMSAGFPAEALSVYVLAGLPGQRAEEVEDSVRHVMRYGIRVRIAEYSPVPQTELWDESVRRCRYPLAEEPLYHNNSFFPLEWEGFTRQDLERIKSLARSGREEMLRHS